MCVADVSSVFKIYHLRAGIKLGKKIIYKQSKFLTFLTEIMLTHYEQLKTTFSSFTIK